MSHKKYIFPLGWMFSYLQGEFCLYVQVLSWLLKLKVSDSGSKSLFGIWSRDLYISRIGLHSVRINSWFKRINSTVTVSLDGREAAPKHCHNWVCSGVFDVRHGYFYPHRVRWWQSLEHFPQSTLSSEARPLSQTFITSSTWLLLLAGGLQGRLSLTSEARSRSEQPAIPFHTPANRDPKTKPVFQCTPRLGKRPYVF